jgi:DNA repair protein SbcC/Rad50
VLGLTRELERLDRELAAMAEAQVELTPLRHELELFAATRTALAEQDELARAESRRVALMERVKALAEEQATLAERAAKLDSAPELERDTQKTVQSLRFAVTEAERTLDADRTAWARDRQEAETRLEALRTQYAELADQKDKLEGLGEDSPCPTCNRPLGASYRGVLELVREQLETVRIDGNYYRQRAEQLTAPPAALEALEQSRRQQQTELASAERRLARIQAAIAEAAMVADQRAKLADRLAETTRELADIPAGYEPTRHSSLRAEVARLQALETRAARLGAQVERQSSTTDERARVAAARAVAQQAVLTLDARRATLSMDDSAYLAVRTAFEQAADEAQRAELEAVAAHAESERAHAALDTAEHGRRELARLQVALDALEGEKRLHEELDRALTDLRTDLNFQLRPELSDIASRFLDALTDGRYRSLEFDEEYRLLVLEDEVPKPVISGGEEDLCNLVLRLAISQMIAERAGQAFSLLILDEVFGSLDDTRRANVVELLRALHDRFEQVIVITHIDQVREGLDRLIQVRFDEARGASVVTS